MENTQDIIRRLRLIRDQMVKRATEEADRWLEAAIEPLRDKALPIISEKVQKPSKISPLTIKPDASLINQVRAAISQFGSICFSTQDIGRVIERFYRLDTQARRSILSNTLRKLNQKYGEIVLIRKGRGSVPSVYRKAQPSEQASIFRSPQTGDQ